MKILVIGNGHSLIDIQKAKERARSGGETKLVNNLKTWSLLGADIWILCPGITREIFGYAGVKANFITLPQTYDKSVFGLLATFVKRTLKSCRTKIPRDFEIIYSSSEFLFDLIPAIIAKKKNPNSKLVACLYLVAPHPLKGYEKVLTKGFSFPSLKNTIFYYCQKISIFLLRKYADKVLVFNELDKYYLVKRGITPDKVEVVSGGVDLKFINGIKEQDKIYEAAFLGRLQPQKGIFDLIEIWKIVCSKKPSARLALIGGGAKETFAELDKRIKQCGLDKNVDVLGFLEGEEIFKKLKSSRIFLCPSKYESWGMVVAEAMACGLPVVSYDLPVFRTIFPEGRLFCPVSDIRSFARLAERLLEDGDLYDRLSHQAKELASAFDWENIARKEYEDLKRLVGAGTLENQLGRQKILLVSHISDLSGPTEMLEDFLKPRVSRLAAIYNPLEYCTHAQRQVYDFRGGKLATYYIPTNVKINPLVCWFIDIVLIFYYSFRLHKKYDLYIGCNGFNAFLGIILKRLGRVKKVIFYTIDWVENRFPYKLLNLIYHALDRFCVKNADSVWNISGKIVELRKKQGLVDKKNILVPVGINLKEIRLPEAKEVAHNKLVFIGALERSKGIDLVIDAWGEILNKFPQAELMIIGKTPTGAGIVPYEEKLSKMKNVKLLGVMSRHELIKRIASFGVGLAPYSPNGVNISRFADPSRVKDYLAAGLPVIITRVPEIASEIEAEGAGVVVDYTREGLIQAIAKIIKQEPDFIRYRENAIKLARRYDYEAIFGKAINLSLGNI